MDKHMDSSDLYAVMAQYYTAIAAARGHFDNEVALVRSIAALHNLTPQSRILDAACGTGDTLAGLKRSGYSSLAGTDASAGMLDQARKAPDLAGVPLGQCRWQDLAQFVQGQEPFELIYILGNSLPHVPPGELPKVFSALRAALGSGGVLAVDFRNWERGASGVLVQPGVEAPTSRKRIGWWRKLCDTDTPLRTLAGEPFTAADCLSYDSSGDPPLERVVYRITPLSGAGVTFCELVYYPFEVLELVRALTSAGFSADDVDVSRIEGWDYMVATACTA